MIKKFFSKVKIKKKSPLKRIAKKNLSKKIRKKVNEIPDKNEKQETLKHLLTSKLYLRYTELENKAQKLPERESVFINLKLMMVPNKIKLFQAGFEKDFNKINDLLNEIEKSIKNV